MAEILTAAQPATTNASGAEPIIIDLGKKPRRQVRKLRRGKPSRLMDRIQEVLDDARQSKAIPTNAQAVVVVVREKKRKNKAGKLWGLG
jgi:hypothetical protein